MADRSLWKLSSPDVGLVDVAVSFPSGAAEDGSFPTGLDDGDGYVVDAYGTGIHSSDSLPLVRGVRGSGVFGVLREGVGLYKIMLNGVYRACMSQEVSLTTADAKALIPQFRHPMLETETGTDGVKRSIVRLRILNTSAADTDLAYNDRVSVRLLLKNSSEP